MFYIILSKNYFLSNTFDFNRALFFSVHSDLLGIRCRTCFFRHICFRGEFKNINNQMNAKIQLFIIVHYLFRCYLLMTSMLCKSIHIAAYIFQEHIQTFNYAILNIYNTYIHGPHQGPYSDQTNSFSTRSGNTSMLEQNILKFFAGGSIRAQDENKCIFLITNHHNNLLEPKKHSECE